MVKQTKELEQLRPARTYEVLASVQTDPGCVRELNEDAGLYAQLSEPDTLARKGRLALVADGMGGHSAGEVASGLAVEVISRTYYEAEADAPAALRQAFAAANRRIYEAATQDEKLQGMGTTCTALALCDGAAFAAHVGDSRLYLVRDDEIYLLTEDHSAVMELVKQGLISPAEARRHPDKNVILRALGTTPAVEASMWDEPLPVRTGDQFLLCSDGLHDLVADAEIKEVVSAASHPHEACTQLIALARARGGHDNITVGIISLRDEQEAQVLRPTREVEVAQ